MTDIATTTRLPRYRRAAEPPRFEITARDIEIVRQVERHRFLRSTHVSRLLDGPHKKILERLKFLFHGGFLERPIAQLEYHVTEGRRNPPIVCALGNRGAELLRIEDGLELPKVNWTDKNKQSRREFILHTLSIADVRVALAVACRTRDGLTLRHSTELLMTLPEQTRAERSPWTTRVRVQHNGAMAEISVLPDFAFALYFPDGRRRPFVVECDRGTMPVERATLNTSSMLRKFLAYEGMRQQSLHKTRYGWQNFRVLVVTNSPERIATMRAVIERTPLLKGSPLFLFADHATLMQSEFFAHPWVDSSGNTHSLI